MKKKLFALVMAMLMVLSLAACGGSNDPAPTGPDTSADASTPADTNTDASAGPADTGAKVDTNTVAVGAVVIARDDVPEDDI